MAVSQYYPANAAVFMGLSTDTKPANVAFGSRFIETDTGKVWMYYNTATWAQVAAIATSGWTETGISISL